MVIKEATGVPNLAQTVGEVIEVLGGKVTSIVRQKGEDFDCLVMGEDKRIVKKVALIFSCDYEIDQPDGSFDLELRIGKQFGKRF